MAHRPGVISMPIDRFLLFTPVILERVSGTSSLTCDGLVICRFVALDLTVKGTRRKGSKLLLFCAFEVFPIGSALWFVRHGIVVGFKHFMDEFSARRSRFPFPSATREVR